MLIVVGRQDTGDLEAQIRGSRHAWDIRLISVDSLLRLLAVKESVESPETDKRIGAILVPREYTRVDDIIDLVFAAAADVVEDDGPEVPDELDSKKVVPKPKPSHQYRPEAGPGNSDSESLCYGEPAMQTPRRAALGAPNRSLGSASLVMYHQFVETTY